MSRTCGTTWSISHCSGRCGLGRALEGDQPEEARQGDQGQQEGRGRAWDGAAEAVSAVGVHEQATRGVRQASHVRSIGLRSGRIGLPRLRARRRAHRGTREGAGHGDHHPPRPAPHRRLADHRGRGAGRPRGPPGGARPGGGGADARLAGGGRAAGGRGRHRLRRHHRLRRPGRRPDRAGPDRRAAAQPGAVARRRRRRAAPRRGGAGHAAAARQRPGGRPLRRAPRAWPSC